MTGRMTLPNWPWICKIPGVRHKWDTDIDSIPESSLFARVDCERCGYAIDGAALRRMPEHLRRLVS